MIRMLNMKEKTKTIELTERECTQVKVFILLGIWWDYEEQWIKSLNEGSEDDDFKAKIDYYRALAKKFDW